MRGALKGLERDHKARLSQAWHIVALDRTSKLPPLAELFGEPPVVRKPSPQTKNQLRESLFAWQFATAGMKSPKPKP